MGLTNPNGGRALRHAPRGRQRRDIVEALALGFRDAAPPAPRRTRYAEPLAIESSTTRWPEPDIAACI